VSLLAFLLYLVLGGFILGGLARLAVPGPDPMPFWLTVAFGIGGALVGGLIADIFFGRAGSFLLAYLSAIALVVLYRRTVQKRPVFGPKGRQRPTRGWGLRR
jgi:uncharacterized membrane protein YeaQ/YmgE (transglycosylase-associated protein family)